MRCLSENDTHHLFWVWAKSHHALTRRSTYQNPHFPIVKSLRFQHMDLHYLGNVVASNPMISDLNVLPYVMTTALALRGVDEGQLRAIHPATSLPPTNRSTPPGAADWAFKTTVTVDDVVGENGLRKSLGLVAGYPLVFFLRRDSEGDDDALVGCEAPMHFSPMGGQPPLRAVTMQVKLRLNGKGGWTTLTPSANMAASFYATAVGLIEESWPFVMRKGSPLFPEGTMTVELECRLLTGEGDVEEG